MKDLFEQLFKPNEQGQTNAFGSNPDTMSLASLLRLQGVNPREAYVVAAQMNQKRAINQQKTAKMQQEQLMKLKRQEALNMLGSLAQQGNTQGIQEILYSGAFSPQEIATLTEQLSPQEKESVAFNPVTGESVLKKSRGGKVTGYSLVDYDNFGNFDTPNQMQGMPKAGGVFAQPQMQQQGFAMPQGMEQNEPYYTPKERMEMRREEAAEKKEINKENRKQLGEVSKVAVDAQKKLSKLDTIEKVIDKMPSGFGAGVKYVGGKILNTEGAKNYERFEQATNELVLEISQNQKGAQSDRDMEIIGKTKPFASNTPEGNKAITKSLRALYLREIEYSQALNEWVKKGGNISDFNAKWASYANANPVLEENNKGALKINQNNLRNWKKELFTTKQNTTQKIDREALIREIERRRALRGNNG